MYQALYRSFRPETFDTLLGQEHIVKILRNQISSGRTGHAYIFTGTRGTGKTTTARLLAKALNCTSEGTRPCGKCPACRAIAAGSFLDVVEIDAASNNGVEDIRDLRESVNFPPAVGKCKVYIIDEAHMLTGPAANALLKTLEEPPENVVFILATTEPNKLPATILSRCLRLDFRRVAEEVLIKRFKEICAEIGVTADIDALALIASNADGSVRDGLSLLDRCVSSGDHLTRDDVLFLLGMAGIDTFISITDQVISRDTGAALTTLADVLAEGKEVQQFTRDWIEHLRDLLIIKYTEKPENVLNLSLENISRLKKQSSKLGSEELRILITELSKALADAKWSPRPRILIELAIVRMCSAAAEEPVQMRPEPVRKTETKPAAEVRPLRHETAAEIKPLRHEIEAEKISEPAKKEAETAVKKPVQPEKIQQPAPKATPISFSDVEDISDEELAEINKLFGKDKKQEDDFELWEDVLHDPRVSIQLQMSGASLYGINDDELAILVSNQILKGRFEAQKQMFETIITEKTGKNLRLVVKTE